MRAVLCSGEAVLSTQQKNKQMSFLLLPGLSRLTVRGLRLSSPVNLTPEQQLQEETRNQVT